MEIYTLILILTLVYLFQKFKKFREKRLVEKIMQESIDLFKKENPKKYLKIKKLNKKWSKELAYSGHLGSIRDGSDEDRLLNIEHDIKVDYIREELEREVKFAHFKYYVKAIMKKYGCDEKLTLTLLNYQSGCYTGTEATVISKTDIGFDRIPADELL